MHTPLGILTLRSTLPAGSAAMLFFAFLTSCTPPPPKPELRGVWVTNVDSDILLHRDSIAAAMEFLAAHNFNAVFPVVWNKAMTLYPSTLMDTVFGIRIDTLYRGRDPLQEVVEEAHRRGIAVIPWFEFGFSSSYRLNGGHLLDRKPDWAARSRDGALLEKNGFEWMSAYHPDVQEFLLGLVREVVAGYDIDGIQGDDRLPAQPSEGGYEQAAIDAYRAEIGTAEPPADPKESAWLRWRADRLSRFAARVYREAKRIRPEVAVTWAPSVFPWSYEEYLQDWPAWIRGGSADLVIPQVYRYDLHSYRATLDSQDEDSIGVPRNPRIIVPGILLNVGDYLVDVSQLDSIVAINRERGYAGEVFFFFEGLRKEGGSRARILKERHYGTPAPPPFPRFQKGIQNP